MLYKFAAASRNSKPSAEALGKARAASPAATGASTSATSAAALDGAAPDARQALCALNPGAAAEVYDFLIKNPYQATEIATVATGWQNCSVQRLDAVAPQPTAAPAGDEIQELSSQAAL